MDTTFDNLSFVALMEEAMSPPSTITSSAASSPLPDDQDIEMAVEYAAALLAAEEAVKMIAASGEHATTPPSSTTNSTKRPYKKKQKLSPDQMIPMYSVINHNNVNITDPQITDLFFECPEMFSDDDVKRIKNVQFDTKQSGHAPARQACHTMKMLYLISETYGIPASELMNLCGSMESHKCQASYTTKDGQTQRCTGACSVGHFFCGRHKDDFTHQAGANMLKKRRLEGC